MLSEKCTFKELLTAYHDTLSAALPQTPGMWIIHNK